MLKDWSLAKVFTAVPSRRLCENLTGRYRPGTDGRISPKRAFDFQWNYGAKFEGERLPTVSFEYEQNLSPDSSYGMGMSHLEIQEWASAYIQAQEDATLLKKDEHPLWWAVEKFMVPDNIELAEDCWCGVLAVLSRNPPQEVIGVLAAGPLEDLIDDFGPQFIDRVEDEAKRNVAFRHLLGGVWKSGSPEIWARVENARGVSW